MRYWGDRSQSRRRRVSGRELAWGRRGRLRGFGQRQQWRLSVLVGRLEQQLVERREPGRRRLGERRFRERAVHVVVQRLLRLEQQLPGREHRHPVRKLGSIVLRLHDQQPDVPGWRLRQRVLVGRLLGGRFFERRAAMRSGLVQQRLLRQHWRLSAGDDHHGVRPVRPELHGLHPPGRKPCLRDAASQHLPLTGWLRLDIAMVRHLSRCTVEARRVFGERAGGCG
jgi:hypothetical protein